MYIDWKNEKVLNKCPLCGNELEYNQLNQYSNVYRILKNGQISSKRKVKRDEGSMECGFLSCTVCTFHTDCDYETVTTGRYEHIYIKDDAGTFRVKTIEGESVYESLS